MKQIEREVMTLQDLADYYVEHNGRTVDDVEVVSVIDEQGNRNSTVLDVVIEVTYDDGVDKSEQTPEEENDWLRDAGF